MPLTSTLCQWKTTLLLTTAYLGSLFYSPIAAQPGWDFSDSVNAAGISQSSRSSTAKKKESAKTESKKTDSSKKKASSKTDDSNKSSTDKKKESEKGKSAQSKNTESSKTGSKSSSKESEKKKADSSKTDTKKSDPRKNGSDSEQKTSDAKKSDTKPDEKPQSDKPAEPAPQQVIVTSTVNQKGTRNIAVEVVSSTVEHAADAGKSGLKSIINLPKALAGGAMRLTETFIKTGHVQKGTASFYGGDWHGRKTASGETFDMYSLTAAHRTLPFNTHVLVTNLRNGRQTVVRINNRGPFSGGRIIDLSRGAAEKIGMIGSGVAPVKLEILKR